jgi:hypothetical protein
VTDNTRNTFISHIHEDDAGLGQLKSLLGNHGLTIRDSSITSDTPNNAKSPDYIKSEILAPAIKWAGVMIVYVSPGTKDSVYVNWEIEYAHRLGKRIVGVWEHGASGADVPDALDKYADAVVSWEGQRIIDAIEGRINDWQDESGQPREPRVIARFGC